MAPQAAVEIKSFAETRKEIGDFLEDVFKEGPDAGEEPGEPGRLRRFLGGGKRHEHAGGLVVIRKARDGEIGRAILGGLHHVQLNARVSPGPDNQGTVPDNQGTVP